MRKPLLALLLGSASMVSSPLAAQMAMPTDFDTTACTADVANWFPGGISANGWVDPPSSVTFTDDNSNGGSGPNICNFYQWGAQMFLWLSSPAEDGLVLDSTGIYNVLPAVNGQRQLQNAGSAPLLNVALRGGKVDEIGELEQAGGGVLMSQKKSLVYYGVHVNDLYADFLTGQKAGKIAGDPTQFPRNGNDLDAVMDYVAGNLPNEPVAPETLAIELKTSWVDASTVSDVSKFITMPAIVPDYTADSTNTTWTLSGTKQITLALVGMHVVGTVQDHPEFVWATFENIYNAPDVGYYYTNTQGDAVEFPFDSSGEYLFTPTGAADTGGNVQCMTTGKNGSIVANMSGSNPACTGGIVPSSTLRVRPWGSNPTNDSAVVTNNTRLLSINASVRGQLASGDVRSNYVQAGGIWTTTPSTGGDAPVPNQTGNQSAQMRGSLGLYNATMETYSQTFADNCFFCHADSQGAENSFGAFQLSHIYSQIQPLPTK